MTTWTKTLAEAVLDAYADEIRQFGGIGLTRLTETCLIDDYCLRVESTFFFPPSGTLKLNNEVVHYSSKSSTMFALDERGYKFTDAAEHEVYSVVQDYSRSHNAVERARSEFAVDRANNADLNVIGRNFGLPRYFIGTTEEQYRELIKAICWCERQTERSFEFVLNAIFPPYVITDGVTIAAEGNRIHGDFDSVFVKTGCKLYIDGSTVVYIITAKTVDYVDVALFDNPARVPSFATAEDLTVTVPQFVITEYPNGERSTIEIYLNETVPGALESVEEILQARSYITGGENIYPASNFTLATPSKCTAVHGIWEASDLYRIGTDYSVLTDTAAQVNVANPTRLTTSAALIFVAGDVDKIVEVSGSTLGNNGTWLVDTFIDANNVTLKGFTDGDGVVIAAPSFATETGLSVVLKGAISFTDYLITTRQILTVGTEYYVYFDSYADTYVFDDADDYADDFQYGFYLDLYADVVDYYLGFIKKAGLVIKYRV